MFKIISGLILLTLCMVSHADEISQISQNLNFIEQRIHQMGFIESYKSFKQTKSYISIAEQCIDQNHQKIEQLKQETSFLKNITDNNYGLKEKQKTTHKLQQYRDQKDLCTYLLKKSERLNLKIYQQKQIIMQESLFQKYINFVTLVQQSNISIESLFFQPTIWHSFKLNMYLFFEPNVTLISFLFFIFLNILSKYMPSFSFLEQSLSIKRFLLVFPFFWVLLPTRYMILKSVYANFHEQLIPFFYRPFYFLMCCLFLFTYIYLKLNFRSYKDLLLIFVNIIVLFCLGYFTYGLEYLRLNATNHIIIEYYNYMILFCIHILMFMSFYWLNFRILSNEYIKPIFFKILSLIMLLFFFIGLNGYLNLAINFAFTMIITASLILMVFILHQFCRFLSKKIDFIQNSDNCFFYNWFGIHQTLAYYYTKSLINFIYILGSATLIFYALILILYKVSFTYLSYFMTIPQFTFITVSIQDLLACIMYIIIFNLFNFYISNWIAHRVSKQSNSIEKTAKILKFMGYILIFFVLLKFLGLPLQQLFVLLGGLSIGIGLGLKNLLSNFISSIILMTHKPFEIGDFIQIESTKGYVKKITLLETFLETLDNDMIILPNQKIASSIVQNFTYANKSYFKIHLCYILKEFNIQNENLISEALKKFLAEQPEIMCNEHHASKIIFSLIENSLDSYRLEITFSVDNTKHVKEPLLKINRQIFTILQSFNSDTMFEKLEYPVQS